MLWGNNTHHFTSGSRLQKGEETWKLKMAMIKNFRIFHKLEPPYSVIIDNKNYEESLLFESNALAVLRKRDFFTYAVDLLFLSWKNRFMKISNKTNRLHNFIVCIIERVFSNLDSYDIDVIHSFSRKNNERSDFYSFLLISMLYSGTSTT